MGIIDHSILNYELQIAGKTDRGVSCRKGSIINEKVKEVSND